MDGRMHLPPADSGSLPFAPVTTSMRSTRPPMMEAIRKQTPLMSAFTLFSDNVPPVEQGEEEMGGPIILYQKGAQRPDSARCV